MTDVRYCSIKAEEVGQRLDNYLIRILKGVPKSCIYRIIRSGEVRLNKKRAQVSTRLSVGDQVRIPPLRLGVEKEVHVSQKLEKRLENCILFEDKSLLVVNKPTGIAVHGGSGLSLGMIEALRNIRHDLAYLELVHRLDKETSGCLLFAKKRSTLRAIQALLMERAVTKTYWALLSKPWQGAKEQWVDAPLLKNVLKSGERMVLVNADGKPSSTHFGLIENYQNACWVEVRPKTGRTHQIRAHSAFLNNPIIGDEKYGKIETLAHKSSRLFLHAKAIEFTLNGHKFYFEAPPDEPFTEAIKKLGLPKREE